MSQPIPLSHNESDTSLEQLRRRLKDKENEADKLQATQDVNKRQQASLKQVIDVIEKNLAEFEKDGDELAKVYLNSAGQVEHKLKCVVDQLGDRAAAIEKAFQSTNDAIKDKQNGLLADEKSLTGEMELAALVAKRNAIRSKLRFEQLRAKDLKDRLSQAQALIKEAMATSDDSPADLAKSYVLLLLAQERLRWSRIPADFVDELVEFKFPSDYTKDLVAAYEAMHVANEAALAAQERLADHKSQLDQGIKTLDADRASRKKDAIAAAQEAVGCGTGSSASSS